MFHFVFSLLFLQSVLAQDLLFPYYVLDNTESLNWYGANTKCSEFYGGSLAIPSNNEQNDLLSSLISNENAWLGWNSNIKSTNKHYTKFNNDSVLVDLIECAYYNGTDTYWYPTSCNTSPFFITKILCQNFNNNICNLKNGVIKPFNDFNEKIIINSDCNEIILLESYLFDVVIVNEWCVNSALKCIKTVIIDFKENHYLIYDSSKTLGVTSSGSIYKIKNLDYVVAKTSNFIDVKLYYHDKSKHKYYNCVIRITYSSDFAIDKASFANVKIETSYSWLNNINTSGSYCTNYNPTLQYCRKTSRYVRRLISTDNPTNCVFAGEVEFLKFRNIGNDACCQIITGNESEFFDIERGETFIFDREYGLSITIRCEDLGSTSPDLKSESGPDSTSDDTPIREDTIGASCNDSIFVNLSLPNTNLVIVDGESSENGDLCVAENILTQSAYCSCMCNDDDTLFLVNLESLSDLTCNITTYDLSGALNEEESVSDRSISTGEPIQRQDFLNFTVTCGDSEPLTIYRNCIQNGKLHIDFDKNCDFKIARGLKTGNNELCDRDQYHACKTKELDHGSKITSDCSCTCDGQLTNIVFTNLGSIRHCTYTFSGDNTEYTFKNIFPNEYFQLPLSIGTCKDGRDMRDVESFTIVCSDNEHIPLTLHTDCSSNQESISYQTKFDEIQLEVSFAVFDDNFLCQGAQRCTNPQLPTKYPIQEPTPSPTSVPTIHPTIIPTRIPTIHPSKKPTVSPSSLPTKSPTINPTMNPTAKPTKTPTLKPTKTPTAKPTKTPTAKPTKKPSMNPTKKPSTKPSKSPTKIPTKFPTKLPRKFPTNSPTALPTRNPTDCLNCICKGGITNITLKNNKSDRACYFGCGLRNCNKNQHHNCIPTSVTLKVGDTIELTIEQARQFVCSRNNISYDAISSNSDKDSEASRRRLFSSGSDSSSNSNSDITNALNGKKRKESLIETQIDDSNEKLFPTYTILPSITPSITPSTSSTDYPRKPTNKPSKKPTLVPTFVPSMSPSQPPTNNPAEQPTKHPTEIPTNEPTEIPTNEPTEKPTMRPTKIPTISPTEIPTNAPTKIPTINPTEIPTSTPTKIPTITPTKKPTKNPTKYPTFHPTNYPTVPPTKPTTKSPTKRPTSSPTSVPTIRPTTHPTNGPTISPNVRPFATTTDPTMFPTTNPSEFPSTGPTKFPNTNPSEYPSVVPSHPPTELPSGTPTQSPSQFPSSNPSKYPSFEPSHPPTELPSESPTQTPIQFPTTNPSHVPSFDPSHPPTELPSESPTQSPTRSPKACNDCPTPFDCNDKGSSSECDCDNESLDSDCGCENTNCVCPSFENIELVLDCSEEIYIGQYLESGFTIINGYSQLNNQLCNYDDATFYQLCPTMRPSYTTSKYPTTNPTKFPHTKPTEFPSTNPTEFPSTNPSKFPSTNPSKFPSTNPSKFPSTNPSKFPSTNPSKYPSITPSHPPTELPSGTPTQSPFESPSQPPTELPSQSPTETPSVNP